MIPRGSVLYVHEAVSVEHGYSWERRRAAPLLACLWPLLIKYLLMMTSSLESLLMSGLLRARRLSCLITPFTSRPTLSCDSRKRSCASSQHSFREGEWYVCTNRQGRPTPIYYRRYGPETHISIDGLIRTTQHRIDDIYYGTRIVGKAEDGCLFLSWRLYLPLDKRVHPDGVHAP